MSSVTTLNNSRPSVIPASIAAITTEMVLVTPTMAKQLLERNTINRRLRPATVQAYVERLRANEWEAVHQGIAIDVDGNLLDGQHRLTAIRDAGISAWLNVTRGVKAQTRMCVDRGARRTDFDSLGFMTQLEDCGSVHVATAKAMMLGVKSGMGVHTRKITERRLLDFINQHSEAIEFATAPFDGKKKVPGVSNTIIMSILGRAFYSCERQRLNDWVGILLTGVMHSPADEAAVILRNKLMTEWKNIGSKLRPSVYLKTERALQAFLQGETLQKFYEPSSECFPLPEEGEDVPKWKP